MMARDPNESGRTASVLELFFDLVFVIAVGRAAGELHHGIAHGHAAHALGVYALMFFGIWWAWMNFTWFATSFDVDDWLYRVLTFVQMLGVLVFAAGMASFGEGNLRIILLGYVIMRVALVSQWWRASRNATGEVKAATQVYVVGTAVVQCGWALLAFAAPEQMVVPLYVLLLLAELVVPMLAESKGSTPWHPHHIAERYGLFTIILLGESLLASANAIFNLVEDGEHPSALIGLALVAFVMAAMLFWVYFYPPHHSNITQSARTSALYSYGHYFIFAAAGALAAGMEVQLDLLDHAAHVDHVVANAAITGPVATFLVVTWLVAMRRHVPRLVSGATLAGAVVIVAATFLPYAMLITAVTLVAVVVVIIRCPLTNAHGHGAAAEAPATAPAAE
ncbi:low temperature requirement protein A [Corynebacterium sp. 13CS0277]|nr:low temperature requirement protein A [Corynebacterium sp. 13CS0277]